MKKQNKEERLDICRGGMEGGVREGGEYAELYSRQEVLGEGGFGKVFRVEHLTSGVSFAAKHVVTRSPSPSMPLSFTAQHMHSGANM